MSVFKNKHNRFRVLPFLLGSCLVLLLIAGGLIWYAIHRLSSADILQNDFIKQKVVQEIGEEYGDLYDIMPSVLGLDTPKTYLLLFLNNTELRPGGGFIGSYAVVRMNGGSPEIITLDGVENLDRDANRALLPEPPEPLKDYLGVSTWYFRDSNWSPDFQENARFALELYAKEGGTMADEIDGVIGVTPTVLEELLRLVGPVTVQDLTFTADNVTETLEYEVEYAYLEKDIHRYNRKDILEPLLETILSRMKSHMLSSYQTYLETVAGLMNHKQIMIYHSDPFVESIIEQKNWAGRVAQQDQDYLLWVDANLGALKTDHALDRSLSYELLGPEDQSFRARASMTYKHTGTTDWRTTRYITYSRIFVPLGSRLVGVEGTKKDGSALTLADVDTGTELGKTWFGAPYSIEPGQTKTLRFTYVLPPQVVAGGVYSLVIQKQLGTGSYPLTLNLDFATLLQSADPPEAELEWHDGVYEYTSDLSSDRQFSVTL